MNLWGLGSHRAPNPEKLKDLLLGASLCVVGGPLKSWQSSIGFHSFTPYTGADAAKPAVSATFADS